MRDKNGQTVLHYAAKNGQAEYVDLVEIKVKIIFN
jgi:ankyrin repeat protein